MPPICALDSAPTAASLPSSCISGLLLAGGRGSRMGGLDKGLQQVQGRPLVEWVLGRLQPQVGAVRISANRNLAAYAAQGLPVLSDADDSFAGPLAGLLAGLKACDTEWLLSVPCDTPLLPLDLAQRLSAAALHADADLAVPLSANAQDAPAGEPAGLQIQPVFCLLRRRLQASLAAYLHGGGRRLETWLRAQKHVLVPFEAPGDAQAFFNANHLAELQHLQTLMGPAGRGA